MCSNTVATKSGIIVESPFQFVSRSFGLVIMISHTTDLKVSLYSAAILTAAAFVQREASIYGTCFAIVLALGRSLARALCRFLPERRSKFVSNNHSRARIPVTRYLSAVICIFYVLFFCIKAHA
jgi:predicted glycosyltransferase